MQQQDYFIRIIEEFMAAVARFLEKAEGKRNDDELRDLYRQYVGDYELLRNMTVEEPSATPTSNGRRDSGCKNWRCSPNCSMPRGAISSSP